MSVCSICLEADPVGLHPACVQSLFGTEQVPSLDLDLARMHTAGLAMVGRTSISGVQRKVSLGFSVDRQTLQIGVAGARFILKPQAGTYPNLPENEHLTMRLAAAWGIEVPPCGLLPLRDGSWAYLVARFDRPASGGKLHQEDFCQLAEKPPKEKYDGSAELCVRIVRKYASEPGLDLARMYRLLVFAWWTGNGDLHLKNLALLRNSGGLCALSPAYDLLCTRLVIPDDPLALPVGGRKDGLDRATWLRFAEYARLPARVAEATLDLPSAQLERALALVERSFLPEAMKVDYAALLHERAGRLRREADNPPPFGG